MIRHTFTLWMLAWLIGLGALRPLSATGQTENGTEAPERVRADSPNAESTPFTTIAGVHQAPLDAHIRLPERPGSSVYIALPNFSLEEFDALMELRRSSGAGPRLPEYTLQSLTASGVLSADGSYVTLDVHARIETRSDRAVFVPLDLHEAVIPVSEDPSVSGAARHDGPGGFSIHRSPEKMGGYGCILRPSPTPRPIEGPSGEPNEGAEQAADAPSMMEPAVVRETLHDIRFQVAAPVRQLGDSTRLSLSFPTAMTSELRLKVPTPNANATVSGDVLLTSEPVVLGDGSEGSPADGTLFIARNLHDTFQITWQASSAPVAELPPRLSVENAVVLAALDDRSAKLDVTLPVRSHGRAFDRFHIRLPRGMKWTSLPGPFEIRDVTDAAPEIAPKEPQPNGTPSDASATTPKHVLLEVQLSTKTVGPVEVRFTGTQQSEGETSDGWFELGGIEVLEADEQWGHLGIEATRDWLVQFGARHGVYDLGEYDPDELSETFGGEDVAICFEFSGRSYSLPARVLRRQAWTNVKPEQYHVVVEKGEMSLDALFNYHVNGAATDHLQVVLEMNEWQFTDIGPSNVVASDQLTTDTQGRLVVPLLAPATTAPLQIHLQARRRLDSGPGGLETSLPSPVADWVEQAPITIQAADNLKLSPREDDIQGLERLARLPGASTPAAGETVFQQAPLLYRGNAATSVFSADIEYREQQVSVKASTTVDLRKTTEQVVQTLQFRIDYEPLDRVVVEGPRRVFESGETSFVTGDGRPLRTMVDADSEASMPENVLCEILLPEAMIGDCVIEARSSIGPLSPRPNQSAFQQVSLLAPYGYGQREHELSIAMPEGIRIEWASPNDVWSAKTSNSQAASSHRIELTAETPAFELFLTAHLEDSDLKGQTVIQRAWIQTWIGGDQRRDRVVYRFTSDKNTFDVRMPADADGQVFYLDGKRIDETLDADDLLSIPLPNSSFDQPHVIELRYFVPFLQAGDSVLGFEYPAPSPDAWIQRTYWQVVMPSSLHLADWPASMSPVFDWSWRRGFFGRVPSLEQADLEIWSGGLNERPLPESTSRYVFASPGDISRVEIRVVSRSFAVLAASATALLAGLAIIYFPVMRKPVVLLLFAGVLAGSFAMRPTPMLLAAQASGLGLIAATFAGLLYRALSRRRFWQGRDSASSVYVREHGSSSPMRSNGGAADDSESYYPMSTSDLEQ